MSFVIISICVHIPKMFDSDSTQALLGFCYGMWMILLAAGTHVLLNHTQIRAPAIHDRSFMEDVVPRWGDWKFKQSFRLPRSLLQKITDDLSDELRKDNPRAHSPATLVGIAVYRLAHTSSVHTIANLFRVSPQTVNYATWKVLPLIVQRYRDTWVEGLWPRTNAERDVIAASFERRPNCRIPYLVGAIDGTHVPMPSIPIAEGEMTESYHNFKHFYSLTFLHVIDHIGRHMYITGGLQGCLGDRHMLARSTLWANLAQLIPHPYWISGDCALPTCPQILRTLPKPRGRALAFIEAETNTRISAARVISECGFGMTKMRWRVFLGKTGVLFRTEFQRDPMTKAFILDEAGKRIPKPGRTFREKYTMAWLAGCILHNMARTASALQQGHECKFEESLLQGTEFEKQASV